MVDQINDQRSSQVMERDMSSVYLPETPPPEYEQVEKVKTGPPTCVVHAVDGNQIAAALPLLLPGKLADLPPEYTAVDVDDEGEESCKDLWETPDFEEADGESWSELDCGGRLQRVAVCYVGKAVGLLTLLYLFICSLDFLSSSFRLLGGKAAGEAFSDNQLLQNPIAGLMIGILATVLVQSSSTSTSITVTMVASGILDVRPAIPIIMGANIGTSVTNTIVSMAQSADRDEFRRAFAGATVHDMFNWLSVLVFLPLEIATGYLYHLTSLMVNSMNLDTVRGSNTDLLKKLTKPFTQLVIQLDKKVIEGIAMGNVEYSSRSLIKHWCKYEKIFDIQNVTLTQNVTMEENSTYLGVVENITTEINISTKTPIEPCTFLFHDTGLSDTFVGLILLFISLVILCSCLVLLVKLLHSMLKGRIAKVIKKTINSDFPGKLSFLTGYVALLIGAGMTILVQSSSVFTSAMTPLVGMGVIKLERMYPLTLGSNIGTTATGLLAAMAASGDKLPSALQIGLCHLFFNISGIALFYPVPFMRVPIKLAKIMGNTTANYRWFALFYLAIMFFVIPAFVFTLSVTCGIVPMSIVVGSVLFIFLTIIAINVTQHKKPQVLPVKLRNWEFLPEFMHSLEPLDRIFRKLALCCPCCCRALNKTLKKPQRSNIVKRLPANMEYLTVSSAETSTESSPSASRYTSISILTNKSTSTII